MVAMERHYDASISTIFAVCPVCHRDMILVSETKDGKEEWHCEGCWYAFNEAGERGRKVYFGHPATKCPECGDHRIMRDPISYTYFCRGCKTEFPDAVIEPIRNRDGEINGCKLTDFGDPRWPKPCPNCGDLLRLQTFYGSGPYPDYEAFVCGTCDLAYMKDEDTGYPRPWPECPRCGHYSLMWKGDIRQCHFCKVETTLDGDYLHDADRPAKKGEGEAKDANPAMADLTLG